MQHTLNRECEARQQAESRLLSAEKQKSELNFDVSQLQRQREQQKHELQIRDELVSLEVLLY